MCEVNKNVYRSGNTDEGSLPAGLRGPVASPLAGDPALVVPTQGWSTLRVVVPRCVVVGALADYEHLWSPAHQEKPPTPTIKPRREQTCGHKPSSPRWTNMHGDGGAQACPCHDHEDDVDRRTICEGLEIATTSANVQFVFLRSSTLCDTAG